ncbi:hypothetical protein WSM22_08630 [Cytophagales bacterium WSM2-2]|nr:hypothetical protein WSM22_08630 [Cytophagales bacterium WSM2-2]
MKAIKTIVFLLGVTSLARAQSTNATLNEDYYHWITRYEIKAGRIAPELFSSVQPFKRKAIVAFVDSLEKKDHVFTSQADKFNYDYLRNDNWEWSKAETSNSRKAFWGMYKKKSDLANVDVPDFDFHVSPVLYLSSGKDSRLNQSLYLNSRGVEMRGMIDRKIGFYTFFTDNQTIMPAYAYDQLKLNDTFVVPHEGFWKTYKNGGVDFFQVRGYIDFNVTKNIYVQFGHDRTFIGNGFRSLIFSDYSPPNLFLRANAKIWKLNYLFQLNRLTADPMGTIGGSTANKDYPVKFMAFHHASINIGKKFNLGVFESVVFTPQDTINKNNFQLNYLNPIIFFRAIEQQGGSPDNVLLGGDFKWNAFKKISFYGQVVMDEFVLKELRSGKGWWANKFALQGGLKYIDAFNVPNLDIQLEGNLVKPYTYSHDTQYSNYSNYAQSLAHPLGANLMEGVAIVRYQPLPKLNLIAKSFYTKIGRDTTGVNWGSDILKNNSTRSGGDYGHKVGEGVNNTITFMDFTASYMVKHNVFIDFKATIRRSSSPVVFYNNNSTITSVSLRWNIPARTYDF